MWPRNNCFLIFFVCMSLHVNRCCRTAARQAKPHHWQVITSKSLIEYLRCECKYKYLFYSLDILMSKALIQVIMCHYYFYRLELCFFSFSLCVSLYMSTDVAEPQPGKRNRNTGKSSQVSPVCNICILNRTSIIAFVFWILSWRMR